MTTAALTTTSFSCPHDLLYATAVLGLRQGIKEAEKAKRNDLSTDDQHNIDAANSLDAK